MKGKKILIGISGSIAAYKMPALVRLCMKAGADVKVVMTPRAASFVSPLVLSTLSRHDVLMDLSNNDTWSNHVALGRWADIMLIAPASCNTLAKMAQGICDNLLLAVYLSATCPVMIAPAMDEDMWKHAATQKNIQTLRGYGHEMLPTMFGELASGLTGLGRMAEPETIIEHLHLFFINRNQLLHKKALVTAGPTYENIDPVRFIGNYSSGKMGIAIAEALAAAGCDVELILGPVTASVSHPSIHVTSVRSAEEMYQAAVKIFPETDIAVMSAAVADYTPVHRADQKIKKTSGDLNISLQKTKDILHELGTMKKPNQLLIGFALESSNEKGYALDKLQRKNADYIVMNSLNDEGAGFGSDTNKITIFGQQGFEQEYALKSKTEVARDIVDLVVAHINVVAK